MANHQLTAAVWTMRTQLDGKEELDEWIYIYIYYVYGIYKDMFRVVSPETGRMPACNIDFGGPASSGAQRYHHWQAIHVKRPI